MKHEVNKMRGILSQAQKYIQIEDATRSIANRSYKERNEREKQKPQFVPPKKNQIGASDWLGPLPRVLLQFRFLLVTTNYFTKLGESSATL